MGKYVYLGIFLLFTGLTVAAYAYLAYELDGSTITTKRSISQPQQQQERPR